MSPLLVAIILFLSFLVPCVGGVIVIEHFRAKRRDVNAFIQNHPFIPEQMKIANAEYAKKRAARRG